MMSPATAQRLLTDPEVKELFEQLRKELFMQFSTMPATDQAGLTLCRMKLEGLDWFQGRLTSLAHDFTRQRK
jgi:hypothetical protein